MRARHNQRYQRHQWYTRSVRIDACRTMYFSNRDGIRYYQLYIERVTCSRFYRPSHGMSPPESDFPSIYGNRCASESQEHAGPKRLFNRKSALRLSSQY